MNPKAILVFYIFGPIIDVDIGASAISIFLENIVLFFLHLTIFCVQEGLVGLENGTQMIQHMNERY